MVTIWLYFFTAIAVCIWFVLILRFYWVISHVPWLSQARIPSDNEDLLPSLSVIVPARNEDVDIERAVESLFAQKNVDLELIVINDHSTDRTSDILSALAKKHIGLKVISNPELREGWLGKCNAMDSGFREASHELILFTDADTIHHKKCLFSALTLYHRNRYDFMSLFPRFEVKPFWEHVILPMYIAGIAQLISPKELEDPQSEAAVGTGALMLTSKSVLNGIGSLEKIKGEMADDIALSKAIKQGGFRVAYFFAPELLFVNLFKTNSDAFFNTVKNVLLIVEGKNWLAIPVLLMTVILFWSPVAAILYGLFVGNFVLFFTGFLTYIVQYLSLISTRSLFHFRSGLVFFFPLVVVVVTYSVLKALYFSRRGEILWRGRVIKRV